MSDIDVSRTLLLVREFGAYVLALPGIGTRRDKDDVAVALLAAATAAAREDCRAYAEPLAEALRASTHAMEQYGTSHPLWLKALTVGNGALAAYDRQAAP